MYDYDGTAVRQERLAKGTDHCGSTGAVYALVDLVKDGLIMDPDRPGTPLTARRTSAPATRVLIYAVNFRFDLRVGFDGTRGELNAVKHETLFHNANVRAAGELEVVDGIIVNVNDHSGSYGTVGRLRTDRRFAMAVLTAIDLVAAPTKDRVRTQLKKQAGQS